MNWAIHRVSGPSAEVLTTTDAKKHLHVEHSDEDAYIGGLCKAARELLEVNCNRSFTRQTWDYFQDEFPDGRQPIYLPRGPVISVTSVKYTTLTSTTAQTLSATTYITDRKTEPARIALRDGETWPTNLLQDVNGVQVRFVAGLATSTGSTATGVPAAANLAAKLLVGQWYTDRESSMAVNPNTQRAVDVLVKSLDARRYM